MSSQPFDPDGQRRRELGEFLRARRERVQPAAGGRRRRAKGLLREEVAERAGVSVTWYTWLEQARPTNPSARVLEGLATALQLDGVERSHLFRLARPDLRSASRAAESELGASLVAVLQGLTPHPAYAVDASWDVLGWNAPADALFDFASMASEERNILRALVLDEKWRALFVNWEALVSSAIAQFRAGAAHLADDPRRRELLSVLESQSRLFAELWNRRELEASHAKQKIVQHPRAGLLTFNYATFRPDDAPPEIRFSIYTPADADVAARTRALLDGSHREHRASLAETNLKL